MAKSLRNKSKQANRRKKRNDEQSHYAIVEAQRLKAVSERLLGKKADAEGAAAEEDGAEGEDMAEDAEMQEAPKKISTSGTRQNRREAWRESKGMEPRPKNLGQNKQGKPVAKRKAGRNKRRR